MSENKPREFWIGVSGNCSHKINPNDICSAQFGGDHIHVREVLPNEASEIETLRKQLEVAVNCSRAGGIYRVQIQLVKYTPIGEPKLIDDPNRKWWQIWKPKKILHQEYNTEPIVEHADYTKVSLGEHICYNYHIQWAGKK